MRAVLDLPGEHRVHDALELDPVGVPPGLDGGLAGHGVQDLVPRALGVRGLSAAELLQDLLHRGRGVAALHVSRHRAQDVVALPKGLDLKAEFIQELRVCLKQLLVLLRQAEGHALKQRLRHDGAILAFQPVKNHALVGGVLVDQQQLPVQLHDDVKPQRLPHDLVVGKGGLFHILNRVFHNFAC